MPASNTFTTLSAARDCLPLLTASPGLSTWLRTVASLGLAALTSANALQAADAAAAKPPVASRAEGSGSEAAWTSLFDGKSLRGWKVTDFAGRGEVKVDPAFKVPKETNAAPALVFEMGAILTGVTWTNEPPTGEYEVSLDAVKLDGTDFFCALTFPAGGGTCSLIVGGWGGSVVGISSIDGMDASENETTKFMSLDKNHWYHIRVRVTKDKIQAWIDKDKVVDVVTTDHQITVRPGEIELAEPFGLSAYETKAAYRNFRWRHLEGP